MVSGRVWRADALRGRAVSHHQGLPDARARRRLRVAAYYDKVVADVSTSTGYSHRRKAYELARIHSDLNLLIGVISSSAPIQPPKSTEEWLRDRSKSPRPVLRTPPQPTMQTSHEMTKEKLGLSNMTAADFDALSAWIKSRQRILEVHNLVLEGDGKVLLTLQKLDAYVKENDDSGDSKEDLVLWMAHIYKKTTWDALNFYVKLDGNFDDLVGLHSDEAKIMQRFRETHQAPNDLEIKNEIAKIETDLSTLGFVEEDEDYVNSYVTWVNTDVKICIAVVERRYEKRNIEFGPSLRRLYELDQAIRSGNPAELIQLTKSDFPDISPDAIEQYYNDIFEWAHKEYGYPSYHERLIQLTKEHAYVAELKRALSSDAVEDLMEEAPRAISVTDSSNGAVDMMESENGVPAAKVSDSSEEDEEEDDDAAATKARSPARRPLGSTEKSTPRKPLQREDRVVAVAGAILKEKEAAAANAMNGMSTNETLPNPASATGVPEYLIESDVDKLMPHLPFSQIPRDVVVGIVKWARAADDDAKKLFERMTLTFDKELNDQVFLWYAIDTAKVGNLEYILFIFRTLFAKVEPAFVDYYVTIAVRTLPADMLRDLSKNWFKSTIDFPRFIYSIMKANPGVPFPGFWSLTVEEVLCMLEWTFTLAKDDARIANVVQQTNINPVAVWAVILGVYGVHRHFVDVDVDRSVQPTADSSGCAATDKLLQPTAAALGCDVPTLQRFYNTYATTQQRQELGDMHFEPDYLRLRQAFDRFKTSAPPSSSQDLSGLSAQFADLQLKFTRLEKTSAAEIARLTSDCEDLREDFKDHGNTIDELTQTIADLQSSLDSASKTSKHPYAPFMLYLLNKKRTR